MFHLLPTFETMPAPKKNALATPVQIEPDPSNKPTDVKVVRQGIEDILRISELIRLQQSNVIESMVRQGPSASSGSSINIDSFKLLSMPPIPSLEDKPGTETDSAETLIEPTPATTEKSEPQSSRKLDSSAIEIIHLANSVKPQESSLPPTLPPPPPPLRPVKASKVLNEAGYIAPQQKVLQKDRFKGRLKRPRKNPQDEPLSVTNGIGPGNLKRAHKPSPLQILGKGPYFPPIIPPASTHGLPGFINRLPLGVLRPYEGMVRLPSFSSTVNNMDHESPALEPLGARSLSDTDALFKSALSSNSAEVGASGLNKTISLNIESESQLIPTSGTKNPENGTRTEEEEVKLIGINSIETKHSVEDESHSQLSTDPTKDTHISKSEAPTNLKKPQESDDSTIEEKPRTGRIRTPVRKFVYSEGNSAKAKSSKGKPNGPTQPELSLKDSEGEKPSCQSSVNGIESKTSSGGARPPVSDVFVDHIVKVAPMMSQPPSAQMCYDDNGTFSAADSMLDIAIDIPLNTSFKKGKRSKKPLQKLSGKLVEKLSDELLEREAERAAEVAFEKDIKKEAPLQILAETPIIQPKSKLIDEANSEIAKQTESVQGTILFRGSDAFNFTIFKGSDEKAKENFMNICKTAWDKYLTQREKPIKVEKADI